MDYTENYHLKLPADIDFYDVEDFNSNARTIDAALKQNAAEIKAVENDSTKIYIQTNEPAAEEGAIWINPGATAVEKITLTPINGFTNYNGGEGDAVVLTKIGDVVEMQGRYNPSATSDIGSASEVTMCTVPQGYRPTRRVVEVMQGSNGYVYQLCVNTSGAVTACRHRNGADYMSATATMQLWIRAVWITAE